MYNEMGKKYDLQRYYYTAENTGIRRDDFDQDNYHTMNNDLLNYNVDNGS